MTGKSSDAAGHLVGQDADWAEISDTLYGRGFQETSWSQDITASFAYGSARIFIHPANREDREDSSEGSRRFFVTEDTTSFEFATDDLHEAIGVAQSKGLKQHLQDGQDFFSQEMIASFANAARPTDEELEYCLRAADLPHDAAGVKVARQVFEEGDKAPHENEEFEFDVNLDDVSKEELDAIANDPKNTDQIREYAKKSAEAKRVRSSGKIQDALKIERQLDKMYNALPENLKSW